MSLSVRTGIPRESGDDPGGAAVFRGLMPVFPARAGMIPPPYPICYPWGRIPRESGDDPVVAVVHIHGGWYSPRERG